MKNNCQFLMVIVVLATLLAPPPVISAQDVPGGESFFERFLEKAAEVARQEFIKFLEKQLDDLKNKIKESGELITGPLKQRVSPFQNSIAGDPNTVLETAAKAGGQVQGWLTKVKRLVEKILEGLKNNTLSGEEMKELILEIKHALKNVNGWLRYYDTVLMSHDGIKETYTKKTDYELAIDLELLKNGKKVSLPAGTPLTPSNIPTQPGLKCFNLPDSTLICVKPNWVKKISIQDRIETNIKEIEEKIKELDKLSGAFLDGGKKQVVPPVPPPPPPSIRKQRKDVEERAKEVLKRLEALNTRN